MATGFVTSYRAQARWVPLRNMKLPLLPRFMGALVSAPSFGTQTDCSTARTGKVASAASWIRECNKGANPGAICACALVKGTIGHFGDGDSLALTIAWCAVCGGVVLRG